MNLAQYQEKFLSGNIKLPEPPEVEIISAPRQYAQEKSAATNAIGMKADDKKEKKG